MIFVVDIGFWKFVEVDSGFGCFLWPILDFENCCGQFRPGQCLLFLVLEGWIKILPNPILTSEASVGTRFMHLRVIFKFIVKFVNILQTLEV